MRPTFSKLREQVGRVAVAVAICLLLITSSAMPAMAFGSSSSSGSEGTAQMNQLQETSKRAVESEPRSREEVQRKAQQGPNAVQGGADLGAMNSPKDSGNATTVKDQIKAGIKNLNPNS